MKKMQEDLISDIFFYIYIISLNLIKGPIPRKEAVAKDDRKRCRSELLFFFSFFGPPASVRRVL